MNRAIYVMPRNMLVGKDFKVELIQFPKQPNYNLCSRTEKSQDKYFQKIICGFINMFVWQNLTFRSDKKYTNRLEIQIY